MLFCLFFWIPVKKAVFRPNEFQNIQNIPHAVSFAKPFMVFDCLYVNGIF